MITIKIQGGLGNQLFQYAVGKAVELRHLLPVQYDISFLNDKTKREHFTPRDYELSVFNINPKLIENTQFAKYKYPLSAKDSLKVFLKSILRKPYFFWLIEDDIKKIPLVTKKNVYLEGFWQSESLFAEYRKEIVQSINIKSHLLKLDNSLLEAILSKNSVSVHFRRGDYVNDTVINSHHGVCSLEYYENAVRYIQQKEKTIVLFIFSDDLEWVKNNYSPDVETIYVNGHEGFNSYLDMVAMSQCKHNIVANSTFSWWGAWLNENPEKIVVAPEKWFDSPNKKSNHIIPEDWVKL